MLVSQKGPSLVQFSFWLWLTTVSEVVLHDSTSTIRDDLDSITAWAEENCMNLNAKKRKDRRISFLA